MAWKIGEPACTGPPGLQRANDCLEGGLEAHLQVAEVVVTVELIVLTRGIDVIVDDAVVQDQLHVGVGVVVGFSSHTPRLDVHSLLAEHSFGSLHTPSALQNCVCLESAHL